MEKDFDTNHRCEECTWDRYLARMLNPPATKVYWGGGFWRISKGPKPSSRRNTSLKNPKPMSLKLPSKIKVMSANTKEICERLQFQFQEEEAVKSSDLMRKKLAIADERLDSQCIYKRNNTETFCFLIDKVSTKRILQSGSESVEMWL